MQTEDDWEALRKWMDDAGVGRGPIEAATPLVGGTQNLLFLFRRGETDYVLRRPPPRGRASGNETMRREAQVLAALAETEVPHARLVAPCHDQSVLGTAFYIMEPVDGFNATTGMPDLHASSAAVRRRMGFALVEGIAALGALDYEALGLQGFGRPEKFLERQVSRWRSQLDGYAEHANWPGPTSLPGVDEVGRWLEDRIPRSFLPGVIHGDYHLANVMYRHDGPELAAIVDWELSTIGDPLLDLGWLLATWPDNDANAPVRPWDGFPGSRELIEHYAAHSSRDLAEIRWYGVLACYKLGIILEGSNARACAGLSPRETGDSLHAQAISLFERALRWIG